MIIVLPLSEYVVSHFGTVEAKTIVALDPGEAIAEYIKLARIDQPNKRTFNASLRRPGLFGTIRTPGQHEYDLVPADKVTWNADERRYEILQPGAKQVLKPAPVINTYYPTKAAG